MSRSVMKIFGALSIVVVLLLQTNSAWARKPSRLQINATVGARFGGRLAVDLQNADGVTVDSSTFTTDSSVAYGGLISYLIQENGNVFLSYSRQETTMRLRTATLDDDSWSKDATSGAGSIEYFQFGGNLQANTPWVVPYFGASIGVTRLAALDGNGGDWARFNVTLDGGVRFDFIPLLDLRVFSRVPFTLPAAQLYCFSDAGCALVANGNPFVQGEVHAGAGIKF